MRDTFRAWVADFIPIHREEYPGSQITKDDLRREIFEQFPKTRIDYNEVFLRAKKRQQRDITKRLIRPTVRPSHNTSSLWCNVAAQGLKQIVFNSDYSLGFAPTRVLQSRDGLYDEEEVETFIKEAWEAVGDVAWRRHCKFDSKLDTSLTSEYGQDDEHIIEESSSEPESEEDEDTVRFPAQPEGYRQTWWDSDANDI